MNMKINDKVFCFPPYISTSWVNVLSLKMRESDLVISLEDGEEVVIPGLSQEQVQRIFFAHARAVEKEIVREEVEQKQFNTFPFPMLGGMGPEMTGETFKIGFSSGDNLGAAMQHNPAQSEAPDLPKEALKKIASIARIVSNNNEIENFPKPEPHCNCMHCQISREIHAENENTSEEEYAEDEVVKDDELKFSQWEIQKSGDNVYKVINRAVDLKEEYTVSLGPPVCCSCRKKGCEHIPAVLRSYVS